MQGQSANYLSFFFPPAHRDDDLSVIDPTCASLPQSIHHRTDSIPHSGSAPVPISASPAALYLSSFGSPPSAVVQDGDGDVGGYTLGTIIGYGASSIIRRAYSSDGDLVAVKIVKHCDFKKRSDASRARRRIKQEAAVWSTLSHENILPLFSAVHTNHADYFFTLFCPSGSLFDILKRDGRPSLPQDDAGMMFRQVVRGLRYLHEVALYVHRDIKLENVLVDDQGDCRICDFGMTRKLGYLDDSDESEDDQCPDERPAFTQNGQATVHRAFSLVVPPSKRPNFGLKTHATRQRDPLRHRNSTSTTHPAHVPPVFQPGSLPYAAPELLLPQMSGPLLPHPAQDIWALGVLLYCLLTGRLPFNDSFEPRLQMKILNGTYQVPPDIGRGAERILRGCLDRSTTTRWTIARVDELAWGVGWGAEGDTPADSEDEEDAQVPTPMYNQPCSRSHSRPREHLIPSDSPNWLHEEQPSRASLEVAERRSLSRYKRSLSRAPVLGRRALSRSSSRQPSPGSVRSASTIRSPSSSRNSVYHDSAIIVSPETSLERGRGRGLRKRREMNMPLPCSPSQSPGPPPQLLGEGSRSSLQCHPRIIVADKGKESSVSRGRQRHARKDVETSELAYGLYSPVENVDEESSDWVSGPLSAGFERRRVGDVDEVVKEEEEGEDIGSRGYRNQSQGPRRPLRPLRFARMDGVPSADGNFNLKKRCESVPPTSTVLWPSMPASPVVTNVTARPRRAAVIYASDRAAVATRGAVTPLDRVPAIRKLKRSKSLGHRV